MCEKNCQNPCDNCTRVVNPSMCENKNCKLWKSWFLRRWAKIYAYGRQYNLKKKGGYA